MPFPIDVDFVIKYRWIPVDIQGKDNMGKGVELMIGGGTHTHIGESLAYIKWDDVII
jgi:hypothetical protein